MSRIGNYLIESEESGEIRYDDRQNRYIHKKLDTRGQHSSTQRSKARDGNKNASRLEGSNE